MKRAIRTSIIEIDSTEPDGVQWASASIQTVEVDEANKVISVSGKRDTLARRIDLVATEIVSVYDPVTGITNDISVAGVGKAIELLMVKWMLEDNPEAYFDPEMNRVVIS